MERPIMDKRIHPIRIVIADDHPIFHDGLRRLLESEQDMKVVGEACDGYETVKLAEEIKPDILLVDLTMQDRAGLDQLRDVDMFPGGAGAMRIILLTAAAEKKQVVEALHLGAHGVVLKDSVTQLLLKSIHAVMSGEYWVGRDSVSNLVQHLRNLMQSTNEESKEEKFGLTPLELEIVSAVVAGYGNREIAEYFKISHDTVLHHLSDIFDKLAVCTRLELAMFAVNHGFPLKASL
jgi:DNA-binding NarL/FixJ family response regulator